MSEDKKTAKQEALRQVVQGLEKTYGQGTIMQLCSGAPEPIAVIPSGALVLDEALGVGGYPRGRVVEIFGPESSGKTTLTLHAIAEAQRAGGVAAFIDAEHAFDLRYARSIGIDLKKLLMSQPDCGEQALEIAEALTRSGAVDLVVIDSVAALVPKAEIEGDMGDAHMGLQARLMSQALRKLTAVAHKTGTTLIFIKNQGRPRNPLKSCLIVSNRPVSCYKM
jgi:recombination protein RecA